MTHEVCTRCSQCGKYAVVYETYNGYYCIDHVLAVVGYTREMLDRAVRERRMPVWSHTLPCSIRD